MSIEPQKTSPNTNFGEERRDLIDLTRWKSEVSAVGWSGLIPFRNFFIDRPWTLLWVQFMLFAFGFPFLLMQFYREDSDSIVEAAWAFGIYFSIVWAILVHRCIRPGTIGFGRIIGIWLGSSVLGFAAVLIVSEIGSVLPGFRGILNAIDSTSVVKRLFGMTIGVGLVEETAKLLPVLWFVRNLRTKVRPTTIAYLGVISGLAFGATEAIMYSGNYVYWHASSQIGYGDYLLVQLLRLVSLPFLHGIWTGIAAYFAGLSAINPAARRVVILAGLFAVAILHGLYNTFSGGWLSFAVAVLSFGMFIGYVRDEDAGVGRSPAS